MSTTICVIGNRDWDQEQRKTSKKSITKVETQLQELREIRWPLKNRLIIKVNNIILPRQRERERESLEWQRRSWSTKIEENPKKKTENSASGQVCPNDYCKITLEKKVCCFTSSSSFGGSRTYLLSLQDIRYTHWSIIIIMVEGFAKGVKYALFFANVIIFTGGLVVFSIGVWTLSDKSFMERLLGSNLYVASAGILIATGIVVTIISFLGTLGAYREIKCMLLCFFVILFLIFIVMLVGGILGYIFRSEVDERMHTEMVNSVKTYKEDSKVTDAWDSVQRNVSLPSSFSLHLQESSEEMNSTFVHRLS